MEPARVNPDGIRYPDTLGSKYGLLWICALTGKQCLQERGDAETLFAMESVWWRTHDKVAEAINFDAFGTPEQLRIGEKYIPALQEELGPNVCLERWR